MTSLVSRWTDTVKMGWPTGLGSQVIAAILATALITGGVLALVPRLLEPRAGIALQVADTEVSEQQLQDRVRMLRALYGVTPPPAGDPRADDFRRSAAKSMATTVVLDRTVAAHGLALSDADARAALDQMIAQGFGAGGRDAFIRVLGSVGASEADVLTEIRRQHGEVRLAQKVGSEAPAVTDGDLRQEFEQRRSEMVTPERRHLRNIVVSSQSRAQQVLGDARNGVDFATLVSANTLDRSTRDGHGDLGTVARTQLEDGYGTAAFATPPGQFFGPTQTAHGWNVGQVLGVQPAVPLSFDQAKDTLRAEMQSRRAAERWHEFLSSEIANADVEYAPDYRPVERPAGATPTGATEPAPAAAADYAIPTRGSPMFTAVVMFALAALLFAFGRWGQAHTDGLLPTGGTAEARSRKQRQLRRGAIAWQVVSVVPVAIGATLLIIGR